MTSFAGEREEIDLISTITETSKKTAIRAELQQKLWALKLKTLNSHAIANKQDDSMVVIDAIAKGDPSVLLKGLRALGMKSIAVHGRIISGQLPLSAVDKLDTLASLNEVKSSQMITSQGSVHSKGDHAQKSDTARQRFSVSGKGVTIGVLSDSYNCLNGEKKDKASKDLPEHVLVVEEALDCEGRTDEGRALLQIIHDIAPQAKLLFHTGENGLANSANAILKLAFQHKADVIIDDMKSISANFFQEDAITQAINKVVSSGVTYVTAAGNSGRNSYQHAYNEYINTAFTLNAHDFDPSATVDIYQRIHVVEGFAINLLLQWASPAYSISGSPGTQTDLDIFIFNEAHSKIVAASTFGNIGRDPVELIQFFNPENSGETNFDIMITKASGENPSTLKYIILNSVNTIIQEHHTQSGGLFGHANAPSTITVGAANYLETPAFGTSPPLLQNFSSAGGLSLQFDAEGHDITPLSATQKPDIIAPDNVNTTFFGIRDSDNDGKPNISGTSASAPHAAGVIALLLETNKNLQPIDIKKILQQTSIDIFQRNDEKKTSIGNGFDFDSGYGLIDAEAAVNLAKNYTASIPLNLSNGDTRDIAVNDPEQVGGGVFDPFTFLFLFILAYYLKQRTGNNFS
jgi:subtilisin family serine protease